jgi:hypothetical protein
MHEVPTPSDTATRLFAVFSRFEFALKESGFVYGDRNDVAHPDWKRFEAVPGVAEIAAQLVKEGRIPGLVGHPPRLQVATKGGWEWRDVEASAEAGRITAAVRRVRNNLFHGGKSGPDPRDDVLCDEAVACLLALVDAHNDVSAAFDGRY